MAAWPAGRPALEQRGWEWGGTQPVNGWNLPQVGQLDGWCLALKYLPWGLLLPPLPAPLQG